MLLGMRCCVAAGGRELDETAKRANFRRLLLPLLALVTLHPVVMRVLPEATELLRAALFKATRADCRTMLEGESSTVTGAALASVCKRTKRSFHALDVLAVGIFLPVLRPPATTTPTLTFVRCADLNAIPRLASFPSILRCADLNAIPPLASFPSILRFPDLNAIPRFASLDHHLQCVPVLDSIPLDRLAVT